MRRVYVALAALASPALFACSANERLAPAPSADVVSLTAGDGVTLVVDPSALTLKLSRGADLLLDFEADGLQLGAVATLDDQFNYDPTTLATPSALDPPPAGLTWLVPTALKVTESPSTTGSSLTLALTYPEGASATLVVDAPRTGSFHATLTPGAGGPPLAYFRLRPRAGATEGLYGLGETFGEVNQRGQVRAMQLEIDGATESGYNNEHAPIPFVLGTNGWGMFVESAYPGVFAIATDADQAIEATFGTGLATSKGLSFHLFGEQHALDVTRHYYEVTGFPRLPARWALGPWVWRHVASQSEALTDMMTLRSLDLATTGFWFDDGYFSAVGSFDWDPTKFTDAQAILDQAHGLGYGVALWHSPYLDDTSPKAAANRATATSKGYYPPVVGLSLEKGWSPLIDFTNPAAFSWWQGLVQTYTAMGVEGFKLDYAEDVVPGLTNARNVWQFADGSDERTMHARYQLFYHSVYGQTLPAEGGFLLCRHATFGDQTNISVMWPGDLDGTFATTGEQASGYVSVGGMPASVSAGLALGPSGLPFFGADTGGYLHQPPSKEVMTRWFEQTALSTVMQIYADNRPWVPDATTGYDAEMLGWLQTYMRLHLRLFPYEWTYAQNLASDGRPIARALGLAHPELGVHPSDTYLFGDVLLVAPVMEAGATSRSVTLPAGGWVDWWTGAAIAGGGTITATAPLGTLPLFLQAGGIVPMLRPTIATMRPVTEPYAIDSYATTPGVLWVRVAPGPASSFTVFDGAALSQEATSGALTLTSTDGNEFASGVMWELIGVTAAPSGVADGGSPLPNLGTLAALEEANAGYAYTSDTGGTIWVKTTAGAHRVVVSR
jgi:alpha-D-xyloside xylohydrolase